MIVGKGEREKGKVNESQHGQVLKRRFGVQ